MMRIIVFLLVSLSFACLIGQFYNVWSMQQFAIWLFPPAIILLIIIAWQYRHQPRGITSPTTWIIEGTLGGIIAAIAYDLYRLYFVLNGAPLFKVFPRFGELLLHETEPRWLIQIVGWTYHFSNGAALGIMFLALIPTASQRLLFWGAIAWAMMVEAMLLAMPYTDFFELPYNNRFIVLTLTAHLVFGIVLGSWCRWRLANRRAVGG